MNKNLSEDQVQIDKLLNKQQTELRQVMMSFDQHDKAIQLFITQHAMLHSVNMAQSELWSFEDEVLNDMAEVQIRRIPQSCEHSVAWCIWHIARIEDVTMNLLVAGSSQILYRGNWLERMKITVRDTGNEMDEEEMATLGATIDIEALRAYRMAVGRRTREIVQQLEPEELKQQVDPIRVQQVMDEGVVVEEAIAIANYWSRRNIAGLLLMPATRHNLVHLNEALRLKRRRQ
ncbi:MAG: DinB family protein [Anaerolineales bacterium]